MSLDEALSALAKAQRDAETAAGHVWAAVQAEHPQVAAAVAAMGFREGSLLKWLCESKHDQGLTPAELIASGQGERVIAMAKRAEHGFF